MSPRFVMFGPSHLIAIAVTLTLPLALALVARWEHPGRRADCVTRLVLAALMLVGWACWYILSWRQHALNLDNALPLNLCDWASAALIVALLTRRQFAYELGYFWGLSGTLQGVITPTIYYDFPDSQFIFFFIQHSGVIAALLYLTLGTGLRPTTRSLPRVIGASLSYAAFAGLVDWLLGVNYGFLRAKPLGASLLSLMSPWPWYIPELVLLGIGFVLLYYMPFALLDAARKGRNV
jgi:hypothetical integral membrane protein (TIGR02206 family)